MSSARTERLAAARQRAAKELQDLRSGGTTDQAAAALDDLRELRQDFGRI